MGQSPNACYDLTVSLVGAEEVRRDLAVSGELPLRELETVIQELFGWSGVHLGAFVVAGRKLMVSRPSAPPLEDGEIDGGSFCLAWIARTVGDSFLYEYDFGARWSVRITVTRVDPMLSGRVRPVCLDFRLPSPSEDCTSLDAFREVLRRTAWTEDDMDLNDMNRGIRFRLAPPRSLRLPDT